MEKTCPKCGMGLEIIYFMEEEPDFYYCPHCKVAYDPKTMKSLANVV